MNKEDKELLLKDLCARLPYKTIILFNNRHKFTLNQMNPRQYAGKDRYGVIFDFGSKVYSVEDCKPYLRPLSSMTEDEKIELKEISNDYLDEWENTKAPIERWKLDAKESYKRAMFYNSHHLDWNDLISKGLAIEVTEENNPYKE